MNQKHLLASMCVALAASNAGAAKPEASAVDEQPLTATISQLDAAFFDAFNHCSSLDQLARHASYLNPNVEFYHDKGGVTWTRKDYLEKTRKNACGHFRRVLTPGSMQVSPIAGYGAIEEGKHSFCAIDSGKCFGEARFLVVWHRTSTGWEITRMFSYQHRAID